MSPRRTNVRSVASNFSPSVINRKIDECKSGNRTERTKSEEAIVRGKVTNRFAYSGLLAFGRTPGFYLRSIGKKSRKPVYTLLPIDNLYAALHHKV